MRAQNWNIYHCLMLILFSKVVNTLLPITVFTLMSHKNPSRENYANLRISHNFIHTFVYIATHCSIFSLSFFHSGLNARMWLILWHCWEVSGSSVEIVLRVVREAKSNRSLGSVQSNWDILSIIDCFVSCTATRLCWKNWRGLTQWISHLKVLNKLRLLLIYF